MNKKRTIVALATVCALSVAASVGTAVYAYYVRHQLNSRNTLQIGNAQMFLTDEGGSDSAIFSADLTPLTGGQFAPETYAQATELAAQDPAGVAQAKFNVSREVQSPIFYGLELLTGEYPNSAALLGNVYVTCFALNAEGTDGTLTGWSHVALEDAGYIEGNMGEGRVTYHMFITYENTAGAGTGSVQFDISLQSSPAPLTAEYDISAVESEIEVEGASGEATLIAEAWYGGSDGYKIMQGGSELYSGTGTLADGWQTIRVDGVNFDEGRATLSLQGEGTLYLKDLRTMALESITVDASGVQTLFTAGGTFGYDGLEVTAHYTDGSESLIYSGFDVVADISAAGVKQATVTYGGKQAGYQIAVVPDVADEERDVIEFTNSKADDASLTLYISDRAGGGSNEESATMSGMYLYSDGEGYKMFGLEFSYTMPGWKSEFASEGISEAVLNDIWSDNNGALFVELGDDEKDVEAMRFKVSSNEWHAKFMGWTETKEIIKVTVPEDKQFIAGSVFDGTGITINYTLTDGRNDNIVATAENIADGTIQFYDAETRENLNSYGKELEAGTLKVRVLYDSKVFDIEITVSDDSVTGIRADASGAKTQFLHGETFSSDGLAVYEVYASGRQVAVDGFEVQAIEDLGSLTGEQSVKVTYDGHETAYSINVGHNYTSSRYEAGVDGANGTFYQICVCEHEERVEVYGNRKVTINGQAFDSPYACYDEQFAGYGIEYDVTKGGDNAEFVITLTAENTGEGGVYADGLNITTFNNNVVIEVAEDVTIPSFNASIDLGHNNVSVTIRGAGKLTVTNEFISTLDNLVILSDVSTTCTFKVANLTFGAEDGSVAPELYILVDGAVNGVETNTFSDSGYNGMDWKLYSGTVTLENKQAANPAFSMNTAGGSLYIGVNATLNSVGFVAAYGIWDGAQNNYRVEVYGTFNAYGTNQTPPNVVSGADPDAATGTYVADGATYQVTDLPLEDWAGSSGGSSEDVTE
ncbi:MAG TPA: bacterial Ig-like domain-containing protein [Candidatus Coproplasma avistercoris]|nr:bacterial Ig-like domain-containing protein [Candidatus Coproplasma avistercoris]